MEWGFEPRYLGMKQHIVPYRPGAGPWGRLRIGAQETTSISALQLLPSSPSRAALRSQRVAPRGWWPAPPRRACWQLSWQGEPTAVCEVTFEIILHGGFSFRMFFKVIHSLSRNCQWWSIRQLVINHRSGLEFVLLKKRRTESLGGKEKKTSAKQGW